MSRKSTTIDHSKTTGMEKRKTNVPELKDPLCNIPRLVVCFHISQSYSTENNMDTSSEDAMCKTTIPKCWCLSHLIFYFIQIISIIIGLAQRDTMIL